MDIFSITFKKNICYITNQKSLQNSVILLDASMSQPKKMSIMVLPLLSPESQRKNN